MLIEFLQTGTVFSVKRNALKKSGKRHGIREKSYCATSVKIHLLSVDFRSQRNVEPAVDLEHPKSGQPIIEACGLTRKVSDQTLLDTVSLSIFGGDRVGITGPTGSGKTVLLRALALLDPLTSGSVKWRGENVLGSRVPNFRSEVIYLHQQTSFPQDSVESVLKQPFQLGVHRTREYCEEKIGRLLKDLDLKPDFLEKQTTDLSGGEMQMTALMRAIQLEPQVLLLDESTSALDTTTQELAEQVVLNWWNADPSKRAFVLVSHDRDQVERLSTSRVEMNAGKKMGAD